MDSSYFTVRVAYNRVNEERFRWALQGASTPKFIWSADVRGLNTLSLTPLDMNQNPITGPNTAVYWIRVDLKPLDESELYMPVYGTLTLSNEIGTESHQVSNIPSPYWSGVIELDNPVMNGQLVVIQARIDYPDGSYDVAQGIGLEP